MLCIVATLHMCSYIRTSSFKGGLKPKVLTKSHGNSMVKLPNVGIVLGWVNFLTLDFQCTLSPIVHPIIFGGIRVEPDISNQPCGNLGACPSGVER
jgi:hypothetical protein